MTEPLSEDRQRVGKYEIVEKIGEGGYSSVFAGFDPLIKRRVAIKSCASANRETRERFYREAEIAGNLDHPNIVRVYDLFIENEAPYLVQELLDGEDLDERIERREPTSFAEKLLYLIQIARGLDYAHARGVIHRDIKPANIRVLDDGTVKILDFGIAKLAHYTSDLTQKGMAVGTAAYLAPEQIRGEKATPATDIFSFGVLAYELLTFVRPFGRETISETFFQTLNYDPEPLTAHWVDCPPELVAVVSRCLHKDAAQRFAGCGDLLQALEGVRDRLRGHRASEPDPAKTQTLPSGSALGLGDRAASRPLAGMTVQMPIRDRRPSRASLPVDLPLRTPPKGFKMAGTARRRPSRAWIPLLLLMIVALAGWPFVPFDDIAERLESAFAAVKATPAGEARVDPPAPPPTPAVEQPVESPPAPSTSAEIEPPADPEPPAVAAAEPEPPAVAATEPEPASLSFEGVWSPRIQLSIDGAPPLTLGRARVVSVEPGQHSLTFSVQGERYRATRSLTVQLAAGESARVPVPIEPPGRVTVQAHLGSPQGLVRLDGRRSLQPTPLRGQPIAPGTHRIEIFSRDDRSNPLFQSSLDVRSGHEAIVTFDLEGTRQPHVRERQIRR